MLFQIAYEWLEQPVVPVLPAAEPHQEEFPFLDPVFLLKDLKPPPKLWTEITKEPFLGSEFDVRKLGKLTGIVWNQRLGMLVCGQEQVEAYRELGMKYWRQEGSRGVVLTRDWQPLKNEAGEDVTIRVVFWEERRHMLGTLVAHHPEVLKHRGPLVKRRSQHPEKVSPKEVSRWVLLQPGWDAKRPKTRGDCVNGPRPCPWASCSQHLYLLTSRNTGVLVRNFPDLDAEDMDKMQDTCALDVADRRAESGRKMTLQAIGDRLGITLERARQVEASALVKIKRKKDVIYEEAQDEESED